MSDGWGLDRERGLGLHDRTLMIQKKPAPDCITGTSAVTVHCARNTGWAGEGHGTSTTVGKMRHTPRHPWDVQGEHGQLALLPEPVHTK